MNLSSTVHCPKCGSDDIRRVYMASGAVRLVCADCMTIADRQDDVVVGQFKKMAENIGKGYVE